MRIAIPYPGSIATKHQNFLVWWQDMRQTKWMRSCSVWRRWAIGTRYLVAYWLHLSVILVVSLLSVPVWAQEESRPALVAVPSFQGELPDGTSVYAIVVVPAENVLNKNAAWLTWEAQWPTQFRVAPASSAEKPLQTNAE